jgi:putative membrane protein
MATVNEGPDGPTSDASRRTYLAEERTFLAWVRSGLGALGVSLGVGRLLPAVLDASPGPYVALGIGFGALGMFLFVFGAIRQRAVERALVGGAFAPLPKVAVLGLAVVGSLLSIGTLLLVATEL